MLAIRLQRRGRKGLAQFRVIVQDSRLSPKSGKVVASLGSYDPHTKESQLDKEKSEFYLTHGAQPSQRVIKLFQDNKITIPDWAELDTTLKGSLKNTEKLRKNQPKEEANPAEAEEADVPEEKDEKVDTETEEETTEKPAEKADEKAEAETEDDDKKSSKETEEK